MNSTGADAPSTFGVTLGDMRAAVEQALDEIRPALVADGGEIELVSVEPDGTVRVKLGGTCVGCSGQRMTLAMTVEPMLKERVPAVRAVVVVT